MPKEIYPSSYLCECDHRSDFVERTVVQAKKMSMRKQIRLGDLETEEHVIVFWKGQMVDILCPLRVPPQPQ